MQITKFATKIQNVQKNDAFFEKSFDLKHIVITYRVGCNGCNRKTAADGRSEGGN